MNQSVVQLKAHRVVGGAILPKPDEVAVEAPLEISLGFEGETASPFMMAMRTPGNDSELVLGLLFHEGLLGSVKDFGAMHFEGSDKVRVQINAPRPSHLLARHVVSSSACGACSKQGLEQLHLVINPVPAATLFDAHVIKTLPEQLKMNQPVFDATGGVHTVALFDALGSIQIACADVGRHNALDKLIGHYFAAAKLPLTYHMVLLSGRASFELIQKAARAGIELVAAIGAPSSMAVQLAQTLGITLLGFLKSESFNVYSHPQRLKI